MSTSLLSGGRKAAALLTGICLGISSLTAQTLINPATDGGFETGTTFAANGWTTANGTPTTRVWYCGTGQAGFTGARAAFIGNNATTVGTNGAARTVHLFKNISIPVGATNIQLSFKYKQSTPDNTYDYLKVYMNSATPVSGTEVGSGLLTTVDPDATTTYATFTTVNVTVPASYAGMTTNLVFTFISDNVTPNGQGAVDDVSLTYTPAPNCSGTPDAGMATASLGSACNADNVSLGLTGLSAASALSFQWQSSTDGVNYANVSGATSSSLSTLITASTDFRCIVGCTVSGASDTSASVHVNFMPNCYCAASSTNTSTLFEKISNVTLNTLNNNSSSFVGYENFLSVAAPTITKGVAENISISMINGYEMDQVLVFIDYNQNGLFTDADEAVYTSVISEGPFTGTFTVPMTATSGLTRMRVRLHDSSDGANLTPCGTATYGQVEDYLVNIVCPTIPAPTGTDAVVCGTGTAELAASTSLSGATLTWYNTMGGPALTTGGTYTTPEISTTTNYYVTASIAGCPASAGTTVTATIEALPMADAGADQAICMGDSTSLTATGAGMFSWNNGVQQAMPFAPTMTMDYVVTVDNGTCSATDTVTVTVNDLPVVTAGSDVAVCAGETVTLTAVGAGMLSWNNGVAQSTPFMPTETMDYIVTVDNGDCQNTDTVTVTVNEVPTANAGADQVVCAGTAVTLTATGTGTFEWDNDVSQATPFTPTATTTYTVTVDNGTCTSSDEVTVTVNSAPSASVALTSNVILTATPAGLTSYQWLNCNGTAVIPGATNATYTATANGMYAVVVSNAAGCVDTSECVLVSTVGVDENVLEGISFYPNPTAANVTITMPANLAGTASVYDNQGKLIGEMVAVENGTVLSLAQAQAGVYLVRVATPNGVAISRVIKN